MTTYGPFVGTWTDPAGNRLVSGPDGVVLVTADAPPPPTPVPDPVPDGVNVVRIGSATYPLAGVNPTAASNPPGAPYPGARGPDQIVAYQRPVTVTATNVYGREVCVIDGVVRGDLTVTKTAVPGIGYVLSGHGKAADWLTKYALPGATVQLGVAAPGPSPMPDPQPSPNQAPQPGTGHGRRRVLWHHGWDGPRISDWPPDIAASLTTVCLAICQSASDGTGKINPPPGVTRAEVLGLTQSGVDVFSGIGGSGQDGIHVTTPQQVSELVACVRDQKAALGITGIIWDLEGTPGASWTVDGVVAASRAMLADGLKVAIWSATYDGRLEAWGQVARALGDDLDHWQRAFYDFPQAATTDLSGIVTRSGDGLPAIRRYLSRDDQAVACFAPVGSLSRSPVPVMLAAYQAGRGVYDAAGWGVWEDYQDARAGWATTRGLAKL
jgi:hypothetical protein